MQPPGGGEITVPNSWFTPEVGTQPDDALPPGWTLNTSLSARGVTRARMINDVIILKTTSGGWCCAFVRQPNSDTWRPHEPTGADGTVSRSDSGEITYHAPDGTVYAFTNDGALASARHPGDSESPASVEATYEDIDGLPRLTELTDPVSNRSVDFTYHGEEGCPDAPDGFLETVNTPRLCEVAYWSGAEVHFFYKSWGLSRIRTPGDEATDFGYSQGVLTSVRSPLVNDAIDAGVYDAQTVGAEVTTAIGYDDLGATRPKATSVTLPEPSPSAARPASTFTYDGNQTDVVEAGLTDGGDDALAYARRVVHDAEGRQTDEITPGGQTVHTDYDDEGRVVSVIDAAGLQTNTGYDALGRPTDTWGPAPVGWFSGAGAPTSNSDQVAHTHQDYDEGIDRLAATWWDNTGMVGPPDLFETAHSDRNFGSGGPAGLGVTDNFSGRLTGLIDIAETDWYDFELQRDGKVRLMIDDELVIDEWASGTSTAPGDSLELSEGQHRITVEYADTTGSALFRLRWRQRNPDESWPGFSTVPTAAVSPNYQNVTSTTASRNADPNDPVHEVTSTSDYLEPHLGEVTEAAADPGGLDLGATRTYEQPATNNYRRQIEATRPSGDAVQTSYYGTSGAPHSADNPCPDGFEGVHQGGAVDQTTSTDPDGQGGDEPIVETYVHDSVGRPVAQWVADEDPVCTYYDSRGRITKTTYPAFGGYSAREVTHDHAVDYGGINDNPLLTSTTDTAIADDPNTAYPEGLSLSLVDLLGRTVATRDVWGTVTTFQYDQAGRMTASTGIVGLETSTPVVSTTGFDHFDDLGRSVSITYNGLTMATVTHDTLGRVASIDYPSGTGSGGNGTSLQTRTSGDYDAFGRLQALVWLDANDDPLTAQDRQYNVGGQIITETTDDFAGGSDFEATYAYDAADRLIEADLNGDLYEYSFDYDSSSTCGGSSSAGMNTNRTALYLNSQLEQTYCYDHADRLVETTAGGIDDDIDYDSHGNTTLLGDTELSYDYANRHLQTVEADTQVDYLRDADGAIVERTVDPAGSDPPEVFRYTSGASGVGRILDADGDVIEASLSLPGGVTVTMPAGASAQTWSYPNLSGSVAALADETGTKTGATHIYDPYGQAIEGDVPDNHAGNLDVGWLGGVATETEDGLQLIEMGARAYSPLLGRFLQVDPVPGGSANDYEYGGGDPINTVDRSGTDSNMWALFLLSLVMREIWVMVKCKCGADRVSKLAVQRGNAYRRASKRHRAAVRYANAIRRHEIEQWAGVGAAVERQNRQSIVDAWRAHAALQERRAREAVTPWAHLAEIVHGPVDPFRTRGKGTYVDFEGTVKNANEALECPVNVGWTVMNLGDAAAGIGVTAFGASTGDPIVIGVGMIYTGASYYQAGKSYEAARETC